MMKGLAICIVIIGVAQGSKIFKGLDRNGWIHLRQKIGIQIGDDVENQQSTHWQCIRDCIRTMKTQLQDEIGLDWKTMNDIKSLGERVNQLFDKNSFQTFCSLSNNNNVCMKNCISLDEKLNVFVDEFKPLEYLCVDHYEEFISHIPCYQKGFETVGVKCFDKCVQSAIGNATDVELAARKKVDTLCRFGACYLECEIPIYDEICDNKEPGKLLAELANVAATQAAKTLITLGKIYSIDTAAYIPQSCKALADKEIFEEIEESLEQQLVYV